jgi:glycosyltransferase involved in cell wall biosynthesis
MKLRLGHAQVLFENLMKLPPRGTSEKPLDRSTQILLEAGQGPLRILFCVNWPVDRLGEPDSSRFSPDYLVPGEPYWFFKHTQKNIHVDVLDCRSILHLERIERRWAHCYPSKGVLAWMRSRQYDVILSHGAQMGLVIGLLQTLFPHVRQTPHVMFDVGSISGGYHGWKNPTVIKGCRLAAKSLAAVISHSTAQFAFYRDRYPEVAKIAHFIPLGVDTNEFQPEVCAQEDEIICVGYSMRNWEMLLRAYASLNTKTRLVLLGIPREKFIQDAGVTCIPRVGIDEMRNWIRRAKFVVLPIPDVDFCIGQQTFLQCMALGKTVLLPSIPAVLDYISDGKTGVLYDVNSEQDLARRLQELLSSSETVERIGRAARDATESQFAETLMADRIVALLRDAVRGSQSRERNQVGSEQLWYTTDGKQ